MAPGMFLYITPLLKNKYLGSMIPWLAQFDSGGNEEAWFRKALAQLPALYNFVEVMVAANLQPSERTGTTTSWTTRMICHPGVRRRLLLEGQEYQRSAAEPHEDSEPEQVPLLQHLR